jgi:hypothetical protein
MFCLPAGCTVSASARRLLETQLCSLVFMKRVSCWLERAAVHACACIVVCGSLPVTPRPQHALLCAR